MVTDDYRGYRKGVYVRFRKITGFPLQNGSTTVPGCYAPGVFCYSCGLNRLLKNSIWFQFLGGAAVYRCGEVLLFSCRL